MNLRNVKETATVLDRLAVGLGSAALAFVIGCIVWLIVWARFTGPGEPAIHFDLVVYFSAAMAVLGFMLKTNVIANIIGWLLHFIVGIPPRK